uniref:Thyroglobulin type-1 domain-containing protein n=1 Tax=Panthera tigris altaica TaxID=74533 RepID=A0A8C9JYZ3_PANTA
TPRARPRSGAGLCFEKTADCGWPSHLRVPCTFQGNSSESEEEHSAGSMQGQPFPSAHRLPDTKLQPLHTKMDVIKKGHAKDSQRYKLDYESQSTDTQNFSSESKRETEYVTQRALREPPWVGTPWWRLRAHCVPCSLPQCRPSKGRKRGFCWCVDKYGQPLPGFDARGKGDVHCYSMDSK